MNLTGKELGSYQIIEEIGRGGMAVVYRAYQPSLNRYVAIKVLPPQLSFDQQFVERFQREARAAAGLRHPSIVVIHDVGQQDGTYYIVMEYLEGYTLKQLIEQEGPLPAARAAHILEQVAAALDYAHRRGFVHRDIKPANIFVGEGDRVTLTDFGIARAASEAQQLTRTGMLVGTPEYMSPEQAEGARVDHRTDLYALGVVLYQMLVGQVPFRGTTPHATLHAVIYEPPPPPRQINPALSPMVEAVVLKAVAKRPEQRFQSGAELTVALDTALRSEPQRVAVPPPPRAAPGAAVTDVVRPPDIARAPRPTAQRQSPVVWILAAIAAVLLLLLTGLILLLDGAGGRATPVAVITQVVTPEMTATAAEPVAEVTATAAIAPSDLPTEVPPTETAALPTDSQVPPTPTSIPPTDTPLPPPETPEPPTPMLAARFGHLAFSSDRDGKPEIYVVDLAGGNPVRLTNNAANDWLPDWSPDGRKIAFTSHRTGSYDLWVMDGDGSGQAAWVTTVAWDEYARWAPDGQRLSLSTTATTEGVPNSEIFVRQADGSLQQITFSRAEDQWGDWSPDGRIIYAEGFQRDSNWDIYVVNADGSNRALWLGGPTCDVQPTWSPDGQWIALLRISHDTNGNGGIDFEDAGNVWVGNASGGGLRELTSGLWATTPAWSPDSQWIAFVRLSDSNGDGRSDGEDAAEIWAVPRSGGDPVPLLKGPHRDGDPSWTW